MAPVVHGLEARYSDRIDFVYLDIDDPRTAPFKSRLGYLVQPHFFMLDGQGEILQQCWPQRADLRPPTSQSAA